MRLWVLAAVAAAERNASRYGFEGNLTQEERAMAEGCARCAASRETVLGAAVRGDALGRHLSITVVPEVPFVIVDFDDRGVAAPPASWGGICLEILKLAASRANFTYDLRLATGHVPGTPDYGTAQADVEGGESDAYLGAFFVTPGRLAKSRMTTPFMGSVGVGLAVEWKPPAKKLDANALAFAPFKADLWAAILVVLFVAAPATFWFLEAPSAARGSDFEEAPGLSWRGLRKNYIHSAWLSWSTFTQAGSHTPKTGEGRVLSAGFTFFTLVTVAVYTAQLTALLVSSEPRYAYTSIQDCARQGGQKLCAKKDTAYIEWLRERYADADLDIIAYDGGHAAMIEALERGDCDAITDAGTLVRYYAEGVHCPRPHADGFRGLFHDAAQDLSEGYEDMAVGVGDTLYLAGIPEALSYHLMALRTEGEVRAIVDGFFYNECEYDGDAFAEDDAIGLVYYRAILAGFGALVLAVVAYRAAREYRASEGHGRTLIEALSALAARAPAAAAAATLAGAVDAAQAAALDAWASGPEGRAHVRHEVTTYIRENRINGPRGAFLEEGDWVYWSDQLAAEDADNEATSDAALHDHRVLGHVRRMLFEPVLSHAFLTATRSQKAAFSLAARRRAPKAPPPGAAEAVVVRMSDDDEPGERWSPRGEPDERWSPRDEPDDDEPDAAAAAPSSSPRDAPTSSAPPAEFHPSHFDEDGDWRPA